MVSYLVRRVIYMILLLVVLSFVSFVLIELPPGDALSTMIQQMRASDVRYPPTTFATWNCSTA